MLESDFENMIIKNSGFYGCFYTKIPDPNKGMIAELRKKKKIREKKRPFDGVFVNRNGSFMIECKKDSNGLEPQQKEAFESINLIYPGICFVFRYRNQTKTIKERFEVYLFDIESRLIRIYKTHEFGEFMVFIKNLNKRG